jgi:hypothetical protein
MKRNATLKLLYLAWRDEEIKGVPQDARKGEAKKRINIKD